MLFTRDVKKIKHVADKNGHFNGTCEQGLMVYSHSLSPGLGQGPGPEPGRMGCMVLRTFHTAPEQEQGPEQGQGRMGYVPIFRILKLSGGVV